MAAFGLEAARYLAENYLDESHAEDFMSAMETVAKYGLNGFVSDSGKVIYNVQEGQVRMSGAPGNYVDMESWLKANDTGIIHKSGEEDTGRSFRHEEGQRLCRLERESGKDQTAGNIPECNSHCF